jgi:fructokinase
MSNSDPFDVTENDPICIGTGLIALDVIIDSEDNTKASLWAGGSCGNILTILAYLGWKSIPIANHCNNFASQTIRNDMIHWGVDPLFYFQSNKGSTPIIIERLINKGETQTHKFQFKCPICSSLLPHNRPISLELAKEIEPRMPTARVFYLDRVSRAALALANEQKKRGALIWFEPASLKNEKLLKEALDIAHIVKYSGEQIDGSKINHNIPLEIQTLGSRGIKYKFNNCSWQNLEAFNVNRFEDAAGAGDWCSAGIIHSLGQRGCEGFINASQADVLKALLFGQALAALKCGYKGARGIMYQISKNEIELATRALLNGKYTDLGSCAQYSNSSQTLKKLCSSCPAN